MAAMKREMDVDGLVKAGKIKEIVAWLTDKIYRHGCMFDPSELIESTCGEPFNPKYFTDYLEKKYSMIIADLKAAGGK
jgi:carboxypeptidase Taq